MLSNVVDMNKMASEIGLVVLDFSSVASHHEQSVVLVGSGGSCGIASG